MVQYSNLENEYYNNMKHKSNIKNLPWFDTILPLGIGIIIIFGMVIILPIRKEHNRAYCQEVCENDLNGTIFIYALDQDDVPCLLKNGSVIGEPEYCDIDQPTTEDKE